MTIPEQSRAHRLRVMSGRDPNERGGGPVIAERRKGQHAYADAGWDAATSLTGRRVFRTAVRKRTGRCARRDGRQSDDDGRREAFLAQLVRNMRASILDARAATDTKIDEVEVRVAQARMTPRPASFRRTRRCRDVGQQKPLHGGGSHRVENMLLRNARSGRVA
jgi:hypothetical protein